MMLQQSNLPSIYLLSSTDIDRLQESVFVDFLNHLLRAEGSATGILQTNIQTSLRIYDPDEGIDARIKDAPNNSLWIPEGLSVWQFKEGDASPSKIREEFGKPGVQEAVLQGGSYCFVIGTDPPGRRPAYRRSAIRKCFEDLGLEPKGHLFTASHIAQWASDHPSLAFLPYFERPVHTAIMRWETWSQQRRFSQPFSPDAQRNAIKTEALRHLRDGGELLHIRLEGLAGIGKTRLALEICRDSLRDRVLYAETPIDIPAGLFHWLENRRDARLVIVVDECDRDDAERLSRQVERCQGRVRLLSVGIAQEMRDDISRPGLFILSKLGDEAMGRLLRTVFAHQPREIHVFTSRLSSGYVKLALKIADAIDKNPTLVSSQDLARDPSVNEVLDQFLVPDQTDRRVMQAIALFNRIGWDDELSIEGKAAIKFFGLNWRDAQSRVGRMVREGFVARQGRYRYVTPHLLAIWLATQVWEDLGKETMSITTSLPSPTTLRAFLERFRDLGDDASAKEVCEGLLEPEGLYQSLDDINDNARAGTLSILSDAEPQAGLRALERIMGHLPRDQLRQLRQGRRQVVWTLERLARLPETFLGAARLLLQLAEAENENIMNNATGVWLNLFGTRHGETAVPAVDRHVLIQEAISSPSVECQLLAVQAVERVIRVVEMGLGSAVGTGPIPVPHWRPSTREEDQEARISGLLILDQAMVASEPGVSEAAKEAFLNVARDLIRVGLAQDVIERLEQMPIENDIRRHRMRNLAETTLRHDGSFLDEAQREYFEQWQKALIGQSYHDRLRRWIGEWTTGDRPLPSSRREKGVETPERKIAALAEEGMQKPDLLRPELAWLASDDARHAYGFGRRIGQLDLDKVLWDDIQSLVVQGKGYTLASSYIQGHIDSGRRDWRDSILDEWLKLPHMAYALLEVIWRSDPDNKDANRLIEVIQNGSLDPAALSTLVYGGQTKHFSSEAFRNLIDTAVSKESPEAMRAVLSLLSQRLRFRPDDSEMLEPVAWKVLEAGIPPRSDTMGEYDWILIAKWYLPRDPIRVVVILLAQFETDNAPLIKDDQLTEVLVEAGKLLPEAVWNEVSGSLLDGKNYRLYIYLRGWFAGLFPTEVLLSWVEEQVPERSRIVAVLTPVEQEPLSDLVRQLLIRYGDDDDVASSLYSNFQTGASGVDMWWGDESAWLQPRLETARNWLNDPEQSVRRWANEVVQGLETRIRRAKRFEEEELF